MTNDLYLVRHGQTLFNRKKMISGWTDSPLTELGLEQARRAGAFLRHRGLVFDHAYTSTLIQLSGCLGDIQVVLKEFIDCGQRLLIQVIR